MMNWLNNRIERASWRAYLVWMFLFICYEFIVFSLPGPWINLIEATANGGNSPLLPDLLFGIHQDQPAKAFTTLENSINDYLIFNALDVPYAFLSMMAAITILALTFKHFAWKNKLLRGILIIPALYFVAELAENALLVSMVLEWLPRDGITATIQQISTTLKISTNVFCSIAGGFALIITLIHNAFKYWRARTSQSV